MYILIRLDIIVLIRLDELVHPAYNIITHSEYALELLYQDHPGDKLECGPYKQVVFICRFNKIESIPLRTCKSGLYKQVVFIYRWSLG